MTWRRVGMRAGRVLVCLFVVWLATVQSARVQGTQHMMRIGLQTMMSEVRLSAPEPTCVQMDDTPLLNVPAECVLVFRPISNGIAVFDAAGRLLTQVSGRLQMLPTVPCSTDAGSAPVPLIRLFGPAQHAEGQSDRLYRGSLGADPLCQRSDSGECGGTGVLSARGRAFGDEPLVSAGRAEGAGHCGAHLRAEKPWPLQRARLRSHRHRIKPGV